MNRLYPGIVIDIGEFKMRVKSAIPAPGECRHLNIEYSDCGETFVCGDCKAFLTPMAVFKVFIGQYERAKRKLDIEREEFEAMKAKDIHLIAAKKVEAVWRNTKQVPACPHCQRGILASDNLGGTIISKALELRRRGKTT
jgi:hypothetical protein